MIPKPRFVYFGTNQLSVIVLRHLLKAGFKPEAVITPPDAPVGRKQILVPCPLKLEAETQGFKIVQPYSLKKDFTGIEKLLAFQFDLGVVAAYGRLIPAEILAHFPRGVLNVHPSLLPQYRGPSPIQTALLNGDKQTGVTIMLLDEQMDHGPILAQGGLKIGADAYFAELFERLANRSGELLLKTIPQWLNGQIVPAAQNESQAVICKKLEWQDGRIDLNKPAQEIYNQIRALSHEPGCWLEWRIKNNELRIMKITKARPLDPQFIILNSIPGLRELNKQLVLVCKNGGLLLEQVQPQGKRVMTAKEFLAGYGRFLKQYPT